jgi:NAD(P)H-flavin reductase
MEATAATLPHHVDQVDPRVDPLCPHPAVVRAVEPETPGIATLRLEFQDRERQERYRFLPGQFNMLYLPGIGEVAISISSAPREGPVLAHTIRFIGRVTRAIEALGPGAIIGLRGPYGSVWPLRLAEGKDVLLVAGGLGLAPLRPAVKALLAERQKYGRLILLYGARQPADLLYAAQFAGWEREGIELLVTVDHADASWDGLVGVVPNLIAKLRIDPTRIVMMTCGPEIMMRFAIFEALADDIDGDQIYLSLERNMQCAVGLCGHCQFGPDFVCKDGAVFPYPKIATLLSQKNF